MLAMCVELGFHIADEPDEPGVKAVTLLSEHNAALTMPSEILKDTGDATVPISQITQTRT
jgi:hypothetical protein